MIVLFHITLITIKNYYLFLSNTKIKLFKLELIFTIWRISLNEFFNVLVLFIVHFVYLNIPKLFIINYLFFTCKLIPFELKIDFLRALSIDFNRRLTDRF